jgi:hypothetical protein
VNLAGYWKEEIVRAHFYDKLRTGTSHVKLLAEFAEFLPGNVAWPSSKREIPFSGSIDQQELFRFIKKVGGHWKPPKRTLGGLDLELIKKMRNDLAHGEETFDNVGSRFSTQDLVEKFDRVRDFMISFLTALERYRNAHKYLIV